MISEHVDVGRTHARVIKWGGRMLTKQHSIEIVISSKRC